MLGAKPKETRGVHYWSGNDFFGFETNSVNKYNESICASGNRSRYDPQQETLIKRFLKDSVDLMLNENFQTRACIVDLPVCNNDVSGPKSILLIKQKSGVFNVVQICNNGPNIEQNRFFGQDTWLDAHLGSTGLESVPLEEFSVIQHAMKYSPKTGD